MNELKCMACQSPAMLDVFDLGTPYLNDYVDPTDLSKCMKFSLNLMLCGKCKLGQLKEKAPSDWSFRNYWYRSSITRTMRNHLREIVESACNMVELKPHEFVMDIGCNDGTLLSFYPQEINRVGFEPALNLTEEAQLGGNRIIADYFHALPDFKGRFKIITAISMFYDVPEPLKFLRDVRECLSPDGVFVVQMNYAGSMFAQNAFDNIGHEHLGYYTMNSLGAVLHQAGLEPFQVEMNDINGGSFRVYAKKRLDNVLQIPRNPQTESDASIYRLLRQELESGLTSPSRWLTLRDRVDAIKTKVVRHIREWTASKKQVYLLGASTRSSTFMQYFELDRRVIRGASERDEKKFGLVTSGTWIPIFSEEFVRKEADCFLVGPWAFRSELVQREEEFLHRGGQMLFPLPQPVVVTEDGETVL